jgi:hypothetical protein
MGPRGDITGGYSSAGQSDPVAELDLPNLDRFVPVEPMQPHNRDSIKGGKVLIRLGYGQALPFRQGVSGRRRAAKSARTPPVMLINQQWFSGPSTTTNL